MFGYKPNVTGVATVDIDVYQQVPSITSGSSQIPDFSYSLYYQPNSSVKTTTTTPINFLIQDPIDFSVSSSTDPTEITIYSVVGNQPNRFLLKKTRKAISATINTSTFSFASPEPFTTININDNNIIGILDIVDSDGNIWYEVDYLSQETIYKPIKNTNTNDPNAYVNSGDAPYILKLENDFRILFDAAIKNQMAAVGASGAIYGLLVAFAFMFPMAELMMMFIPVPIKAKFFVPIIVGLDLFSGVTGFSIFSGGGNIAHFAHIGGALTGFLLMMLWRNNKFTHTRWN
jgi:hypothetical protein